MRWRDAMGALLGTAVLTFTGPASGQAAGGEFRLTAQVVGGGGSSQGGDFVLRGAVSHSASGRSVSLLDPPFQVIGGVLGGLLAVPPARPQMQVRFTADKLAELTWDVDIAGYVLEFSSSFGPSADWQLVSPQPVGTSFTTPCQQPARFFRLRRL